MNIKPSFSWITGVIAVLFLSFASTATLAAAAGKSTNLSFDQIKVAAESGDADAQYALGYMYYYGKSGAPKDAGAAKQWIGKAANQKQPQAMKALALMNQHSSQSSSQEASNQSAPTEVVRSNNTNNRARPEKGNVAPVEVRNEASASPKSNEGQGKMTLVDMRKQSQPTASSVSNESSSGIYTLQLLGSYQKEPIAKTIKDHQLGDQASIYLTTFKDKEWYVLLYGRYKTMEEAHMAAKRLEDQLAVKPWVKPYSSVTSYKKVTS